MKMKICVSFIISVIVGCFLVYAVSFAEDINEIKAAMEKRLPAILELKSKGVVGEDNMGYLQFVGQKREKEDIVQMENLDRKKIYDSIAKKEGVSPSQVGQRRAIQISAKATKGDWLQNQNGKWYQK